MNQFRTQNSKLIIRTVLAFVALFLTACSGSGAALSNVQASTGSIVPGSSGIGNPPGVVEIRYTLGKAADVSVQLQGTVNSSLLSAHQEAGDHILRFSGVIPTNDIANGYKVIQRVVPSGEYTITVSVGDAQSSVPLEVAYSTSHPGAKPPDLTNLVIHPEIITPNSDAVDDVAQLTFRTDQTTTLSVDLIGPDGKKTLVFAPLEKGPGEQNIVLNGQNTLGEILPDGTYTVTVQAQDKAGNRIQAERPLKIEGGGEPSIEVVKVEIAPRQIMIGSSIAVSITVKNTGNVPLRTQGPDPGYTYTTNDSYSSIEGNKWVDRAGLWRVGVDWDGNTGGGPYRYPFRWGLGKTLMPGETVTTGGKITILKQERTMWFYAGVLQEGIRIVLDGLGRTPVDVSF